METPLTSKEINLNIAESILRFPFVPLSELAFKSESSRFLLEATILSNIFWAVGTYIIFALIAFTFRRKNMVLN